MNANITSDSATHKLVAIVINRNNQAANYMCRGEHSLAISVLTSLCETARVLWSKAWRHEDEHKNTSDDASAERTSRQHEQRIDWQYYSFSEDIGPGNRNCDENMANCVVGGSRYYLCKRAILLQEAPQEMASMTDAECQRYVARFINASTYAMIYNMALCHHLHGISLASPSMMRGLAENTSKKHLEQAAIFYGCARNILEVSFPSSGPNPQEAFMNGDCAAKHNVVLLHNLLCAKHQLRKDDESVDRCLPILTMSVVQILEDRHEENQNRALLPSTFLATNTNEHQRNGHQESSILNEMLTGIVASLILGASSSAASAA